MPTTAKQKPVLVVLSSGLTKKGKLPFYVKNKLDQAYRIYHQGHAKKIIVSGKSSLYISTPQTSTDAEIMANYLRELHVPEKDIVKEENSKDLLSAAYFLKKKILTPKKYFFVRFIGVDFEEERIKFVMKKVLGPDFHILFEIVHSQIRSEILWNFFSYERQALSNTRSFLRKMKIGDDSFLDQVFFTAKFYEDKRIGLIRALVHNGAIGKRRSARAHFSLSRINDSRQEIFEKYKISEAPKKILMADFWSGRFINFFAHDADKTLYSLKYVLYVKDKTTFANEIAVTKYLQHKGILFIPTIIAENTKKAPPWYLYKVVNGKNAGEFSYTFAFDDNFYSKNPATRMVKYMKQIRDLKGIENLKTWDSRRFKSEMTSIFRKTESFMTKTDSIVEQAYTTFISRAALFDRAKKYLTHADLHPANIIISRKELYLIDFEHICYNNIAFDFCFVYLFAWNNEEFRTNLYKQFCDSLTPQELKEFEELFPLVYLYFLMFLLRFTYTWEYKSGKENAIKARTYIRSEMKNILVKVAS